MGSTRKPEHELKPTFTHLTTNKLSGPPSTKLEGPLVPSKEALNDPFLPPFEAHPHEVPKKNLWVAQHLTPTERDRWATRPGSDLKEGTRTGLSASKDLPKAERFVGEIDTRPLNQLKALEGYITSKTQKPSDTTKHPQKPEWLGTTQLCQLPSDLAGLETPGVKQQETNTNKNQKTCSKPLLTPKSKKKHEEPLQTPPETLKPEASTSWKGPSAATGRPWATRWSAAGQSPATARGTGSSSAAPGLFLEQTSYSLGQS